MVYLVDCSLVRLSPGQLVDVLVRKDGSSDVAGVVQAEDGKTVSIVIYLASSMPPHPSLCVGVACSHFAIGVHVFHDDKHVVLGELGYG